MKITYVNIQDVNDRKAFSGIPYFFSQALLRNYPDSLIISPIEHKDNLFLKGLGSLAKNISKNILDKETRNYYSDHRLKKIAQELDKKLKEVKPDVVIATSVEPFVYSNYTGNIVLITGGTVKILYEDYANGQGWTKSYYKWLEWRSKKVTDKCRHIICASQYCADSLVKDYNIDQNNVSVIPYGANIEETEFTFQPRKIDKKGIIKFLFVGRQWFRKGGNIAVNICDELKKAEYNIELNVIGCDVPVEFKRNYINNFSYLDKNIEEQNKKLTDLYRDAHFFIVPTQAEFFGIVFSEAAYYGLPVISCKVGALPEIVIDCQTGILMDKEPDIPLETERIKKLINEPEEYSNYSVKNRKRYENTLNWNQYVRSFLSTLKQKKIITN